MAIATQSRRSTAAVSAPPFLVLAILTSSLCAGRAAGVTCTYSYNPTSATFGAAGGTGSLKATVGPAGCTPITPSVSVTWARVTSITGTSSPYTVNYAVDANNGCSTRTATVTQGSAVFRLTQTATGSLSPTNATFASAGGSSSFYATLGSSCVWNASTTASWITVSSASRTGPGSVAYSVAANASCSLRTGTIVAAGLTFTVTQGGAASDPIPSPSSATIPSSGGIASFAVSAGAGCSWTATSNSPFVTVAYPGSGVGPGTVSYLVDANPSCASRAGTITVSSGIIMYRAGSPEVARTFTVNQQGVSATGVLSPSSISVSDAPGSQYVAVSIGAGCSWTAKSNSSWLTVTEARPGPLGSGPGGATVSWGQNPSHDPRTGGATIANAPVTVTQAGSKVGCVPDATTLCLLSSRFSVKARYLDYSGGQNDGRPVSLTPDTGYFWFFTPANVEAVVKIVSFCSTGGSAVAVYGTGLTDLGVTLVVTDSWTGTSRTYVNGLGTPFRLVRDGPFLCLPAPRAEPEASAGVPAWEPEDPLLASFSYVAPAACTPDATSLCLLGGRFKVSTSWMDYGGHAGAGQAVALTSDTGYFWFFSSANVEVVAKMVDFCAASPSRFAVYANGLTDIQVTFTVTDTQTGLTATYSNPLGRAFELIRDAPFVCP